jgi:hypothetical protein
METGWPAPRWRAVIRYRTENGSIDYEHFLNEIEDLHEIVEKDRTSTRLRRLKFSGSSPVKMNFLLSRRRRVFSVPRGRVDSFNANSPLSLAVSCSGGVGQAPMNALAQPANR